MSEIEIKKLNKLYGKAHVIKDFSVKVKVNLSLLWLDPLDVGNLHYFV